MCLQIHMQPWEGSPHPRFPIRWLPCWCPLLHRCWEGQPPHLQTVAQSLIKSSGNKCALKLTVHDYYG